MFRRLRMLAFVILFPILAPLTFLLWWMLFYRPKTRRTSAAGSSTLVVKARAADRRVSVAVVEPVPEAENAAVAHGALVPESAERPLPELPTAEPSPAPPPPDDLKRIEGIGPKIAAVLQEAGITTYALLGDAEASELKEALAVGGVRIACPETWPEQARLAAAGDWDALAELQSELDHGRRK
jgi:small subunit ribosomal protein S2